MYTLPLTPNSMTCYATDSGGLVPRRTWLGSWRLLVLASMAAVGVSAYAANRTIAIMAPSSAVAGSRVAVTITASTDAGGGERIGFFHADYSTDGGATWTGISYATNEGTAASHSATFTAGAGGSKALIRVRVAFRGGRAGDVDYTGKTIAWESSWGKWQEPPAKFTSIAIETR